MLAQSDRPEISYHEYRLIAHLLRRHVDEYGDRLKALVAFGDLVTSGDTFDIDLLEIIDGLNEAHFAQYRGFDGLPGRGTLRLYALSPDVLADPLSVPDVDEQRWVEDLVWRLRQGYEVIMEVPTGWVRETLDGTERVHPSLLPPPSARKQTESDGAPGSKAPAA